MANYATKLHNFYEKTLVMTIILCIFAPKFCHDPVCSGDGEH